MPVTINANGLSIIHKDSGGKASATLPDVCLTVVGPSVVPIPYTNSAKSSDLAKGSKTVTADGGNSIAIKGCSFSKSSGDAAGTNKGIVSGTTEGKAEFITSSPTVKIEGKGVCRLSDQMTMNSMNTMCLGGAQNPPVTVIEDPEGTYTVDLCYNHPDDGSPVQEADFKLIDSHGTEHTGQLNKEGMATVSGLPAGSISLFFGEDKRELIPNITPKENPNYLEQPSATELLNFAGKGFIAFWDEINMLHDQSTWSWGVIMGDLNQDSSAGKMAFDVAVTAFPYIGSADYKVRLTSSLFAFFNIYDIRDENEKYIELTITLAEALPSIGILINGLLKEILLLGKAATLESIAAFLRGQAKGDVIKWLEKCDMKSIKKDIYIQLESGIERSKKLLEIIEQKCRLYNFTLVADAYRVCISQLDDFLKKSSEPISLVLDDFEDVLKKILKEAPLFSSA